MQRGQNKVWHKYNRTYHDSSSSNNMNFALSSFESVTTYHFALLSFESVTTYLSSDTSPLPLLIPLKKQQQQQQRLLPLPPQSAKTSTGTATSVFLSYVALAQTSFRSAR